MEQNNLDRLSLGQSKQIKKELEKDEQVILSTKVHKYNHNEKRQTRILCLTNKNIVNILPDNFARNLFNMTRIKRKIQYSKIGAITVSRHSKEFVIHIPSEYDYRFTCEDFRDQILQEICRAYVLSEKKKLGFFYKDDLTLLRYTTTKFDKNRTRRMPEEEPQLLSPEDMRDNENAKGLSELIYSRNPNVKTLTINDFEIIKMLGKSTHGKVTLCRKKDDQELYAIKSIRRDEISDQIEVKKLTEKKMLESIVFPFLFCLDYAFQTKEKLFYVVKYVKGGELQLYLNKERHLKLDRVKFYAAQIVLTFEYFHKNDIIFRYLKPENVLIEADGYIKIINYTLAKMIKQDQKTYSICGVPDYLAPEILTCQGHSKPVDWWALGILIYEMIVGIPPFYHQNQNIMFERIVQQDVVFPTDLKITEETKDIILQLLNKNPTQRLTNPETIKNHPFFSNIDFQHILNKKIKAPFIPSLPGEIDLDDESTEDSLSSVVSQSKWQNNIQDEFQGMTFIQSNRQSQEINDI